MQGSFEDMAGRRCGRLTVLRRHENDKWKNTMWECLCDCGGRIITRGSNLRGSDTQSCGCLLVESRYKKHGPNNYNWKGGRSYDKDGYVLINAAYNGKRKQVREHRFVFEGHLGRKLLDTEHVHHKNGIRDDNRIENLELKVSPHGAKISVDDAVSWAKETLALYCPEALKSVPYEYPSEECVWH